MTEKKLTKIEKFEMLLNYNGVVAENPLFVELIEHEMELIRKKNAYKSVNKKKVEESNALMKEILDVFYDNPQTMLCCSDIVRHLGFKYTTQKLNPQLKKLVDENSLTSQIDKKIKYYSLA